MTYEQMKLRSKWPVFIKSQIEADKIAFSKNVIKKNGKTFRQTFKIIEYLPCLKQGQLCNAVKTTLSTFKIKNN